MSNAENKALARRYHDEVANAAVSQAQATAARLLTADLAFYANDPTAQHGIEAHQAFLARHHTVSPDQRWACHEMEAEGDVVVRRITASGTQKGEFHSSPPA